MRPDNTPTTNDLDEVPDMPPEGDPNWIDAMKREALAKVMGPKTLMKRQEPAGALVPVAPLQAATAAEKRVQEVSEALLPAFRAASTLRLTEEEAKRLAEPFPDGDISEREDERGIKLLYIEHMAVRQRLIEIFGPGQWSMIRRREWVEDFFTKKNKPAKEIYAEWVMLIRGCRVGETVASHSYYPDNSGMSYADALESTEGEAVRRIAAKMLGCGSQVWISSFREGWQQREMRQRRGPGSSASVKTAPVAPTNAPALKPAAKTADVVEPAWAAELPEAKRAAYRKRWMDMLAPFGQQATEFYINDGKLLDNETVVDLPDHCIPASRANADIVLRALSLWVGGGEPETKDEPVEVTELKARVVPFTKNAGKTFGDLEKNTLWWWCCKASVGQSWVGKDGNERQAKPEDVELRRLLDVAKEYYGFGEGQAA